MRRFPALTVALLLTLTVLFGCKQQAGEVGGSGKMSIVCTIFPQYDWVRQILGDRVEDIDLTLLIDNRVDLHSYQPTVSDIAKISTADLFIHIGGHSDDWVGRALRNAANRKNMTVISLMDALGDGVKAEEPIEGAQDSHGGHASCKHGHKHRSWFSLCWLRSLFSRSCKHDHSHDDEHVWLSLRNAQTLTAAIADALSSIDEDNAEEYRRNSAEYIEKLSALDEEYKAAVSAASVKTLLFGDRFPFRYLVDDYDIRYYAAFSGCSAETEASFETIVFLAKKMDELNLRNVVVTESADHSIARTIIANTRDKDQQILMLNSLQSVTSGDVRDGVTYLSVMESNLKTLKSALSAQEETDAAVDMP